MNQTTTTARFAVVLTLANGFIDAYTYLARGGVFANVQTGNVIFFAINLIQRHWASSFSRLWPILAGAAASRAWGLHAIWIPAGCLALSLVLLVIDERAGKIP